MEFLDLIKDVLGVNLAHFALVSAVIMVIVFVVRLGVKGQKFSALPWFKAVLAAGAIVLGIGVAYVAMLAGIYEFKNHALLIFVGFFNGALASIGWSILKQIPGIKALVAGLAETTEKPKDDGGES